MLLNKICDKNFLINSLIEFIGDFLMIVMALVAGYYLKLMLM